MATRNIVEQFVETMTQLMTLMRREIDVLKARDYGKLEEIQQHKAVMGKAYDQCQSELRKDAAVLAALSPEERGELRTLYARFREALSENMLALKAAQDATDRAVKMIIDGVKKARGIQGQTPAAPGKPIRGYGAYTSSTAGSFAINRTT
ncbi:MAG: flagellar protein FlgN [Alphaproteobacteria bacterium]|nr:flagellar protein FlgN [Alphaproteobacteria bacterium]